MYMYPLGFYFYSYYLAKLNFQSFNKNTIIATLKKLSIYIMQQKKMTLL